MVRQTSLNGHHYSDPASKSTAKTRSLSERWRRVLGNGVRLIQLQFRLFQLDGASLARDTIVFLAILVFAATFALISVAGMMYGSALWIAELAQLPLGAVLISESMVLALVAALLVGWGLRRGDRLRHSFDRSTHELQQNVAWLIDMVNRNP
jgi:Putative Actinobacterial Holin-X, holin superfamily III